ncbi:MAG: Uma2 family endonuclease, partial [Ferruginibacter sp.]
MPLTQKILPHYTYDDYIHWEGRWELIEGHPIAMSPQPILKHQRIASELNSLFIVSKKKNNCNKCKVYEPIDYKIAEDTIIQPDLSIVCKETKK